MRSNESSEDYLETILILGNRSSLVRAVDIAAEMGFKKPSVSVAMKNLRQKNLITVADNGDIRLTEDGHKIADKVYERHQLISSWLMILGVQEKTAIHDACRIEHIISEESFQALKKAVSPWSSRLCSMEKLRIRFDPSSRSYQELTTEKIRI